MKNSTPKLDKNLAAPGELLHSCKRLYSPLGNFITSPFLMVPPETSISEVLVLMESHNSDYAVIAKAAGKPVGIFTKKDLLKRVVNPRINIELPISSVMTSNPVALQTSSTGYEAIIAMVRGGFHHIVLMEDNNVVGVISEHDLFYLQQVSLSKLVIEINNSESLDEVKASAKEVERLIEYLFLQGIASEHVTQIISTLNDQMIKRVIQLEMNIEDHYDIRICWIVMGSEGRYEQTISTDQDNAIIFDHPKRMSADFVRQHLLPRAARINIALDSIGFPLCKGAVMAGKPNCCLSLSEWKQKFQSWIAEPTPEALLNACIYFDFRGLWGKQDLASELRLWLTDAAQGQARFCYNLAEIALEKRAPCTWFNRVFQENHPDAPCSTDIKLKGVNIFSDAARIYALASGIESTKTCDRLSQAARHFQWPDKLAHAWVESFHLLQGIRIRHQYGLKKYGLKAHNRINVKSLNDLEQKVCIEAFRQATKLQKQLKIDFIAKAHQDMVFA